MTILGCGGGAGGSLLGTWRVSEESLPQPVKGMMLPPTFKQNLEQLQALRITFKGDGTYEAVSMPGVSKGHWSMEGNNVKLDTPDPKPLKISNDGQTLTYEIVLGRFPLTLVKAQ